MGTFILAIFGNIKFGNLTSIMEIVSLDIFNLQIQVSYGPLGHRRIPPSPLLTISYTCKLLYMLCDKQPAVLIKHHVKVYIVANLAYY